MIQGLYKKLLTSQLCLSTFIISFHVVLCVIFFSTRRVRKEPPVASFETPVNLMELSTPGVHFGCGRREIHCVSLMYDSLIQAWCHSRCIIKMLTSTMLQAHTMDTFTEIKVPYVCIDVRETIKNKENDWFAVSQSDVDKMVVLILRIESRLTVAYQKEKKFLRYNNKNFHLQIINGHPWRVKNPFMSVFVYHWKVPMSNKSSGLWDGVRLLLCVFCCGATDGSSSDPVNHLQSSCGWKMDTYPGRRPLMEH